MINNISWTSYWQAIAIILLFYYGFILFVYYRKDLLKILAGNKNQLSAGVLQPTPLKDLSADRQHQNEFVKDRLAEADDSKELMPVVQSLIDETVAYMEQAGHAGAVKEEIVFSLQQIIKKYPVVKFTAHQPAINDLILYECETKCSVKLDKDDINGVWKG